MSLFLFVSMFMFTACEFYDYDGFVRYNIPDELVGTVMLPEEWEIVTDEEGWIQFIDKTTGEVLAEQIDKNYKDYNEYNLKYSEFFPLEYGFGTGYSCGGQYYIWNTSTGIEIRTWDFYSDIETSYCIRLYILREDFSDEFLRQIASSYLYAGRE